jgi:hypothetical protein
MMDENFGPREERICWFREHPQAMLVAGPCLGPVDGHEILKRSRAGRSAENLLDPKGIRPLCSKHNSFIEDKPRLANELGLANHAGVGERDFEA